VTPHNKSKLLIAICILGFVIGLFSDPDELPELNSHECQVLALICFVFLAFFAAITAVLEGVTKKLKNTPPTAHPFRWGFFGCCGWWFSFLGFGMATSAIWMDSHRIWEGLVLFGGGAGLIIGVKLASLFFSK